MTQNKIGRPKLVTKNVAELSKRYTKVAKQGQKAVRAEFGLPFAIQDIIDRKKGVKTKLFAALEDGQSFNGSKLQHIKNSTLGVKTANEVVTAVTEAVR